MGLSGVLGLLDRQVDLEQDARRQAESNRFADRSIRSPVLPSDAHCMGVANLFAASHDLTLLRVNLYAGGQGD